MRSGSVEGFAFALRGRMVSAMFECLLPGARRTRQSLAVPNLMAAANNVWQGLSDDAIKACSCHQ